MKKHLFKTTVFFTCFLATGLCANNVAYEAKLATKPEKLRAWHKMAEVYDKVIDKCGLPLDEGIKRTVIAFNLLGFQTSGSCEGHLEWGLCYPWIDLAVKEKVPEEIENEINAVLYQINVMNESGQFNSNPHANELNKRYWALVQYKEQHFLQQVYPIEQLLERFYKATKSPSYGVHIHLKPFSDRSTVRLSVGSDWDFDWQLLRQKEERAAKLKKYRQEMARFTDFLVEYYLSL